MTPKFFKTPADWRSWLAKNHARETELLVGFYKKGSGRPSITWPESVDEALCYGWIDGIRRSIDDESYSIRFTPRKKTSIWSNVNIARVAVLEEEGRMTDTGRAAFEKRREYRAGVYTYEQRGESLDGELLERFKRSKKAYAFWEQTSPAYRRSTSWYVTSAKRDETRLKRLKMLIDYCAKGERIPALVRK